MGLIDDVGAGPVGLDTCVFIYLIEDHATYLPLIEPVFRAVARGDIEVVTSSVTLLEVLVQPYRVGNHALATQYEASLLNSAGVRMVAPDPAIVRAAAAIRAATGAKTPDALQLATAVASGCSAFVANDRRLPEIASLPVLQLGS